MPAKNMNQPTIHSQYELNSLYIEQKTEYVEIERIVRLKENGLIRYTPVRARMKVTPIQNQEAWRGHQAHVVSISFDDSVWHDERLKLFVMAVCSIQRELIRGLPTHYKFGADDRVWVSAEQDVVDQVPGLVDYIAPYNGVNYLNAEGTLQLEEQMAEENFSVTILKPIEAA